jgi:predicted dehydrogenase
MLDEMDDQIDAVTVSTPDHTHYSAAMMAIQKGKHVFVQKPITRTLWECRMLTEAARLHGVSTQMGNQGHSTEGARLLVEWVRAGAIGNVSEIHLWTDRPTGWGTPCGTDRPTDTPPVPEGLDWNLWLGTAPVRPYHPEYAPKKWRSWYDFGAGALGDMGCHIFDASFWALDLGWPEWVSAETSERKPETFPKSSIVTYQFAAKGKRPPVKVFWYDGGNMPARPAELEEGRDMGPSIGGQLLVGDKGKMLATHDATTVRLIPETAMKDFARAGIPPKTIPRIKGSHADDWIQSCKEGGIPASSNFGYSGPLTEMVLLGVMAVRTGEKIVCDHETLQVTSHPEFNKYIREPYRPY